MNGNNSVMEMDWNWNGNREDFVRIGGNAYRIVKVTPVLL